MENKKIEKEQILTFTRIYLGHFTYDAKCKKTKQPTGDKGWCIQLGGVEKREGKPDFLRLPVDKEGVLRSEFITANSNVTIVPADIPLFAEVICEYEQNPNPDAKPKFKRIIGLKN